MCCCQWIAGEKKKESNLQFNTLSFAVTFIQSRDGPLLAHAEPTAGLKVMAVVPWACIAVAGEPAEPWQAKPFTEQVFRGSYAKGSELLRLATLLCHLMWGQTTSFRRDHDFTSTIVLLSVKLSHAYSWFSFGINQVWLQSHVFHLSKTLSMLSA